MPWPPAHVTLTAPSSGCTNVNEYGPTPEPERPVAGEALISRSPAFTPMTGSLNVIEIEVSAATVEFGTGSIAVIVGGCASSSV